MSAYPIDNTLGQQVMKIRTAQDLTRQGLEELSGVSWNTILYFEKGHGSPSIANVQAILRGLGYHLEIVEDSKG